MFDRFFSKYNVDARVEGSPIQLPEALGEVRGFAEFMAQYRGCTFGGGVYRVHTAETSEAIAPHVVEEFPGYRDRITLFGFDWIGRQFGLDAKVQEDGEPAILMLEADTGDALGIPANFRTFHEVEAVDYPDDVFLVNLFTQWREAAPRPQLLSHDEIAGFQVPMFMGGDVVLENLDATSMQVHWSLTAQLWRSTRGLRPGSEIRGVDIE